MIQTTYGEDWFKQAGISRSRSTTKPITSGVEMSLRTELQNANERAAAMARNWLDEKKLVRRWKRLAVVAIVACPGSFVAGGLLLQRALEWWW